MAGNSIDNPIRSSPPTFDEVKQGSGSAVGAAIDKSRTNVDPLPMDHVPKAEDTQGDHAFNTWKVWLVFGLLGMFQGFIFGASSYPTLLYSLGYGVDVSTITNIELGLGASSLLSIFLSTMISKFSDSIDSKFGRRKPFVLFGLIMGFVAMLLLSFPTPNVSLMPAQLAIGTLCMTVGNAFVSNPLTSWLVESIKNQDIFSKINAISGVTRIICLILTVYLGALQRHPVIPFGIACILGVITLPALVYFVPNPVLNAAPAQPPLVPSIRTCIRTNEFRTILANFISISIGFMLAQEFITIVLITSFGFETMAQVGAAFSILTLAVPVVTIIALPLISVGVGKVEKLNIYRGLSVLLWIFAIVECIAISSGLAKYRGGGLTDEHYNSFLILYLVTNIGIIGAVAVPVNFVLGLFLRDLILYDNFINNVNRENIYQQALGVPITIIASTVAGIFKGLVYATGFIQKGHKNPDDDYIDAQYSWNEGTTIQIMCYILLIVTVATFISLYSLKDYSLTTSLMEQIGKVVKKRTEEKAADLAAASAENDRESIIIRKKQEEEEKRFIDEVNLWNYLSRVEVAHIVNSPTENGKNKGLEDIRYRTMIGSTIFAPLGIGTLLWGSIAQLMNNGHWSTIGITLFAIPVIYFYYEIMRLLEMRKLDKLSSEDLKEQAEAAKASNDKFSINVQSLLDENGIVCDDDFAETLPNRRSRTSTLAKSVPEDKLSGYKRQWSVMVLLAIVGILMGVFV